MKRNCWDIKKCGKGINGDKSCPISKATEFNRINSGINGGRFCWTIVGTSCDNEPHRLFALKIDDCVKCEVFKEVANEEGANFVLHPDDINL